MQNVVSSRELTSQEVVLFCEILQSVRDAGVPLDYGLLQAVPQLPPRLAETVSRLAAEISRGVPLEDVLRKEQGTIPPIFQAVLAAGLHHDRTGTLLQDIARTSQHLEALRAAVRRGFIYPVILVLVAMWLLNFLGPFLWNPLLELYSSLQVTPPPLTTLFASLNTGNGLYLLRAGLVVATGLLVYLLYASFMNSGGAWDKLSMIPGAGAILRNIRTARLAHVLSLLVDHGIPLPTSLRLVASGAESRRFERMLNQLASDLETGQPLNVVCQRANDLPALMRWLISVGQQDSRLPETLRESAEYYRIRALSQADWISRLVPLAAIILVGGGVTLIYGLSLFGPMTELFRSLEVR